LTLINRGSGAAADPAGASITAAQNQLGKSRLNNDFGFGAWTKVHAEIRTLDNDGKWDDAVKKAIGAGDQDSNARFTAFDQASGTALTQATDQFGSALRSASSSVSLRAWLLLVVGVLAAAGVWWGVSERLGEYR
jgi:hypothetical protein